MARLTSTSARLHNWLARRSSRRAQPSATGLTSLPPARFEDLDLTEKTQRNGAPRALVQFATHGFKDFLGGRPPTFFNPYGATIEIVRALNDLGFRVDLIDAADDTFEPTRDYAMYVGHGSNYARTASLLGPNCRKARYATGSHVKTFMRDSQKRYQRFRTSRVLEDDQSPFQREVDTATDYSQVELLITLGARTAASYAREGIRSVHVNNAAYVQSPREGQPLDKPWRSARKNFIYVSGTNGNVQKGLDLLLEAFALHPSLHLHIYSKLEEEVLDAYGPELRLPNIHYAYHFARIPILRSRLFRRCAFSICAGVNSGQSTAFLTSLHDRFVPVYNLESDLPIEDCGIVIESNSVEALGQSITKAAEMDAVELRRHSEQALRLFQSHHRPECFRAGMKQHLESLLMSED